MKKIIVTVLVILTITVMNGNTQNLLKDGNFESSNPNGTWPSSGPWDKSWYPYNAGAVTTSTAALKGNCGLWIYTSYGYSFSCPSQEIECKPLVNYTAKAWLRSPWNQSWTEGTKAFISLSFLNNAGHEILSLSSDSLRIGNTGWELFTISMIAPKNAVKVKFSLTLESMNGQSICNADNCVLIEY